MQDHYISINGGNDKGTFAASLGDMMRMVRSLELVISV